MKAERTKMDDPFKILVDLDKNGQTQELEVRPTPLNFKILKEGKTLAKLSRRLGIRSWVLEEGTLVKDQVDQIGSAIESHFI